MNNIYLILFLVFSINTVAFGQTEMAKTDTQEKAATEWKTLNKDNYEIKYPAAWEADDSGQMGTSFILFSPISSETDDFKDNINLIFQDLAGYNLDLDKYVALSEGQIKQMIVDGKIILSERKENENGAYQKVIYTGKQGVYSLKFEQYYWIKNDKAYVLTLTCKADEFDAYQATGEKILDSFNIK